MNRRSSVPRAPRCLLPLAAKSSEELPPLHMAAPGERSGDVRAVSRICVRAATTLCSRC